jgi:hypothetical protein
MQRRFVLERIHDATGISGTGIVCEGCQFSNGKVAVAWHTARGIASVTIYDTPEQVAEIHGHEGRTIIRWLDDPPSTC